jgi:leader peptidase (prepilin peptidase)/N-methyltransferase
MASHAVVVSAAVVLGALLGPLQAGLVQSVPTEASRWPPSLVRDRRGVALGLLSAVLFGLLAAHWADRPALLPAYLYLAAVGVVLAVIDVAHHRLPNVLVLPSYGVLAALLGVAALVEHDGSALLRAAAGAATLFGGLLLLALAQPAAMGFGDVKLAGLLGAALGYLSWGAVLGGIVAAFLLGGLAGVLLLASRRGGLRTEIAFGPFLLAGTLLALLAVGA